MGNDRLTGMEGITLDSMRHLVRMGRQVGKLNLCRYGKHWVLLFRPPGRRAGKTFYLMGEKSRRPRLFAKADTALGIAATVMIPGVWVNFSLPSTAL